MKVGSTVQAKSGIPCIVVAEGKDSETEEDVVLYTTGHSTYLVMPKAEFEADGPLVPKTPDGRFKIALGRYQHFKGTHYLVVCRGWDAKTIEARIAYQAVQGGGIWVRPERMFLEEVVWPDGVRRTRFVTAP